jgi:hypothetical protein
MIYDPSWADREGTEDAAQKKYHKGYIDKETLEDIKTNAALQMYSQNTKTEMAREEFRESQSISDKEKFPKFFLVGERIFIAANQLREHSYTLARLEAAIEVDGFNELFRNHPLSKNVPGHNKLGTAKAGDEALDMPHMADDLRRLILTIDDITERSRTLAQRKYGVEGIEYGDPRRAINVRTSLIHQYHGLEQSQITQESWPLVHDIENIFGTLERDLSRLIRRLEADERRRIYFFERTKLTGDLRDYIENTQPRSRCGGILYDAYTCRDQLKERNSGSLRGKLGVLHDTVEAAGRS